MNVRKLIAGALVPLALACLPGCSMLPEEEEYRSAPVIRDYQEAEYTYTTVMRGPMELTQSLYCRYEPVREEKLSFGIGGLYFEEVYVAKGDYVTAGTLLAELQMGSLRDDIKNCESEISKLKIRLEQSRESMELQLQRHKLYLNTLSEEQLKSAQTMEEMRKSLEQGIQSIEDSLYIQELKLAELDAKRAERQIVAGMDGTVMFVRDVKAGETSTENSIFIRLSDTESSLFAVDTEYYELMKPGNTYEITVNKVSYPVQVVTATEIGIPEPTLKDGTLTVYMKLLEPAVDLESGDRGTTVITLDTREDTLFVPNKALATADGRSFVYYIDEAGMRRMQEVQTGLATSQYTEILSGVDEGDEIILS